MIQSIRGALKTGAELVLVGSGAARRARRRNRDRVSVLAYHNVVEDGAAGRGDVSLHLSLERFRRQLDRLRETHRIVSLAELEGGPARQPANNSREQNDIVSLAELEGGPARQPANSSREQNDMAPGRARRKAGEEGPADRPAAALTFDDGYRGVLRHAVPELVARGLPATVFVCPGLLGEAGFWWDRVADTPEGPAPERRRRALEELGGRNEAVLDAFGGARVPDDYRPIDAGELRALVRQPGLTVASHTWSHPGLTAVDDPELRAELVRSREWLSREAGDAFLADHLSFPYGLWDERVAGAAREAGYRYLYRVEGGPALPSPGGGVLPRVNIPSGASIRWFELRTAGVSG